MQLVLRIYCWFCWSHWCDQRNCDLLPKKQSTHNERNMMSGFRMKKSRLSIVGRNDMPGWCQVIWRKWSSLKRRMPSWRDLWSIWDSIRSCCKTYSQKMVKPADQREAMRYLKDRYQVSERRTSKVLKIYRSAYRRKPISGEQAFLTMRIKEIAASRVRYGYRRIHVLLKREGWNINHKRVYRIYKVEGLESTL